MKFLSTWHSGNTPNPPSSPNNHLWPSAMMKQQATMESENRKSLWRWQSSIHPPYKLSWKKTLVKGPWLYWTGAVTSDKAQCNGIGDPRFAECWGRGWAGAGWLVAGNTPFTQRLSAPSFLAKSALSLASMILRHDLYQKIFLNCEACKQWLVQTLLSNCCTAFHQVRAIGTANMFQGCFSHCKSWWERGKIEQIEGRLDSKSRGCCKYLKFPIIVVIVVTATKFGVGFLPETFPCLHVSLVPVWVLSVFSIWTDLWT